jgi:hypothetical protein
LRTQSSAVVPPLRGGCSATRRLLPKLNHQLDRWSIQGDPGLDGLVEG